MKCGPTETCSSATPRAPKRDCESRVAALLSATLAIIAINFQTQPYLTSVPATRRAGQVYSRIWFDSADNLTGAFREGSRLIVERWPGANPGRTWRFDIATESREQVLWTVAEDGSRLAWISGSSLHIQTITPAARPASSKPVTIALPERHVLALSLLSDGSAAVSFGDSSVGRWEAGSGRALGEWQAPIHDVERAAAAGNYLAFSSIHEGKIAVYNFHGEQWIQVQTAISPEVPEQIVLASSGIEATLAEGRLRAGSVTRPSPGKVRSVAAHAYDFFAAGDFADIFVLPPEGKYYRLAPAAPDSLVACGQHGFAVSEAAGTKLFTLGSENRLTPNGKTVSWTAAGLMLLAAALVFGPFLIWVLTVALLAFRLELKRTMGRGRAPGLPEAPVELVKACASGETILWAGAGLSAQSGFPLRAAFIELLLNAAALEEWADSVLLRKLAAMWSSGKAEAALNQLAVAIGVQRGTIIAHYGSVYDRPFSPPSLAHALLVRLRLHSAVTTNYDVLLEQTDEQWLFHTTTLGSERRSGRFLLKLYGNLLTPSTVLLSQAELKDALSKTNVDALRQTLDAAPLLFVGCSLQGLLADLETIGMPERKGENGSGRTRFAIAGITSRSWGKDADELSRRYGIEALVCPADEIAIELPAFLDRLAQAVEAMPEQGAAAAAS